MGPLIHLFWTYGDVCAGFQGQGGLISGATPAGCIEVSMAAKAF